MKLKQCLLVAGVSQAAAAGMLMASLPASARQFNFSYSGSDINAFGRLTLGAPGTESGAFEITGITGERNGVAISSLLPPGTFPVGTSPDGITLVPSDNLFFPDQAINLGYAGFSFQTADNQKYNVYYDSTVSSYKECNVPTCAVSDPNLTFTSTAVPEPTSILGLLAFGALGTGLVLKKKQA